MPQPPACAALSHGVGEGVLGTAPLARAWLLVHQQGTWGHDALTESGLDPRVGRALAERARHAGVRPGLIRRHARRRNEPGLEVLAASTTPGASWLARLRLEAPDELARLDLDALAKGEPPSGAVLLSEPAIAVCTNGRRDACCAVNGRSVAAALNGEHPERVWETSHLGGHRFAATAVLLPHGLVYGRLDAESARVLLREADEGRMVLEGLRGRSTWSPAGQVAEAEVRRTRAARALDAVTEVIEQRVDENTFRCTVTEADGTRWVVRVRVGRDGPARPASCGASPEPVRALVADPPEPT